MPGTLKKKIKVLHIADKFGVKGSSVHGVSRLFSWWFPRFDASRYTVKLVGLRAADAACENLRQQGIEVRSLGKGKFDFSTASALARLIREEEADIIHLHGYGASNFGLMAARLTNVKTVLHEHIVDTLMPGYQVPFDLALARTADRAIAVSHSVKEFMVRRRFVPEKKISVIFNGAPLHEFRSLPSEGKTLEKGRKKWGIPPGIPVVATVGRLDEQKGNSYFLKAIARLIRKGIRLKALLAGDGPLTKALQEQCRKDRIENEVIFTGYQADVRRLLSIVDVQVFPSLWEGTPLTVFEAMAMQRPIVATNVDGLGEVLKDEQNARVVPAKDAKALAAAIEELLLNPEKARRLADQALQDSRRFDIQETVNRIQEIYDELAGARNGKN